MNYEPSEYIKVLIPVTYINARQDLEAKILQYNEGLPIETRFAYFHWPNKDTDCIDITVIDFEGKQYYHIGGNYYSPVNKRTVAKLFDSNTGNWQLVF